jgi:REP element-mobilizing transposase RayT
VARKPRNETAPGIHHVFARGNNREAIFRRDADRRVYLRLLAQTVARTRWRCLAFCLMSNHVHLVIETREPNLGKGMQYLHGQYARLFNNSHRRSGHLFQGRYGSVSVESDAQLFAVVRYVAMNPVEATLCQLPGDYPWSSCRSVLTAEGLPYVDTERLLSYFEGLGGDGRRRYRELVEVRGEPTRAGAPPETSPVGNHAGADGLAEPPAATPGRSRTKRGRKGGKRPTHGRRQTKRKRRRPP